MIHLAIDVDGCLANFNRSYMELLVKESGQDLFPPGANRDVDNYPDVWYYPEKAGYSPGMIQKAWDVIHASPKFWESLQPLPGARETVTQLNQIAKAGDGVYFLTHRAGYKAKLQTEKWLYKMGMDYPTVLLAADKPPVIKVLKINFFIDDKLDTVLDLINEVNESPLDYICCHVYLKDAPYNREGRREGLKVVGSVREALEWEGLWHSMR